MLIFERKNTVGGASALFLFVETGWRTGKRGGSGRGKGIPVGGALTRPPTCCLHKQKKSGSPTNGVLPLKN